MENTVAIFWFRRDLRLHDNAGLYQALKAEKAVLPLFIFDRNILDKLDNKADARVEFLHRTIIELQEELQQEGSSLLVKYAKPIDAWEEVLEDFEVNAVYTNHDYEPYAKKRDEQVSALLAEKNIPIFTYKDHVIFEKDEVETKSGGIYTVFTPYSKSWKAKLKDRMEEIEEGGKRVTVSYYLKPYPNEEYFNHLLPVGTSFSIPSLDEMGFNATDIEIPDTQVSRKLIKNYDETRNFPALQGTSRLGIHFRFGTISIREKARRAEALNETFLNELIWRDFYAQILSNYPHVAERSFRKKYDYIEWRNNDEEFEAWCEGRTGYPIVDAGMRELNATGFMHNRVRMITASFLTKHLLIDWRWGEAYFAAKLLDFDLASNNGGWQWAAGSGTDAAPYFRIFNPTSQMEKFDKDKKYIKKWVPEYGTDHYPEPIVDHKVARERCLSVYKAGMERGDKEEG
jgi:deoxyribodipyrimidine photo-lyase